MKILTPELLKDCFENGEIQNAHAIEIIANFLHNIAAGEGDIVPDQLNLNNFRSKTKDIEDIYGEIELELHVIDSLLTIGKIIVNKANERSINNQNKLDSLVPLLKDAGLEF
jgi:hypothetical protein